MTLTSDPFLALLSLVAAATMAATVVLWSRVSGHKKSHVAARTGLLIATQLTAIVAVLGGLNAYFSFIVSWSDLVGTHASATSSDRPRRGARRRGRADRRHAHADPGQPGRHPTGHAPHRAGARTHRAGRSPHAKRPPTVRS